MPTTSGSWGLSWIHLSPSSSIPWPLAKPQRSPTTSFLSGCLPLRGGQEGVRQNQGSSTTLNILWVWVPVYAGDLLGHGDTKGHGKCVLTKPIFLLPHILGDLGIHSVGCFLLANSLWSFTLCCSPKFTFYKRNLFSLLLPHMEEFTGEMICLLILISYPTKSHFL